MKKRIFNTLSLVILIMMTMTAMMTMASCSNDEDISTDGSETVYEESPNTLEGTWHLAKALYNIGGFQEFKPGDVTAIFKSNHTMEVTNKTEGNEWKHFMDSGVYTYEIGESIKNEHDGITYTSLDISGRKCTYWFKDGMMTLDYGMAVDAPGYFFKKVKGH